MNSLVRYSTDRGSEQAFLRWGGGSPPARQLARLDV